MQARCSRQISDRNFHDSPPLSVGTLPRAAGRVQPSSTKGRRCRRNRRMRAFAVLPLLCLSGCVLGTVAETAVDVVTLPVKVVSAGCRRGDHQPVRSRRETRPPSCARRRTARPRGALMLERCRKGRPLSDRSVPRRAEMRYFLDTEFNGFDGALLSLALVPRTATNFTSPSTCTDPIAPVGRAQRHAVSRPCAGRPRVAAPRAPRGGRRARRPIWRRDPEPELVADWPEDFTQFCSLLMTGPGRWSRSRRSTFRWCRCRGSAPPPTAPSRTMRCTTRARSAIISCSLLD